jgi:nucleotide-binding universal stress UspA family protein
MRKILIPIDFDAVSANALRYAVDLFAGDGSYTLLHVLNRFDNAEEKARERLRAMWDAAWTMPGDTRMNILVLKGDVVDLILETLSRSKYQAVVMGTRDQHDVLDRWFGTTANNVARKSSIPVYLVPAKASFTGFDKVLVASDYHMEDDQVLQFIKTWNGPYRAFLKFLHVQNTLADTYQVEGANILKSYYEQEEVPFSFEVTTLPRLDVSNTIIDVAVAEKADLLMVVSDDHPPLNDFLFKSVSRDLAIRSEIPICFIPFNK